MKKATYLKLSKYFGAFGSTRIFFMRKYESGGLQRGLKLQEQGIQINETLL